MVVCLVRRCLAVQEAALLDGATSWETLGPRSCRSSRMVDTADAEVLRDGAGGTAVVHWRRQVGDVLGDWVLGAHGACVDAVAFAGLGHGVIARVEVLAFFEMLGKVVGS